MLPCYNRIEWCARALMKSAAKERVICRSVLLCALGPWPRVTRLVFLFACRSAIMVNKRWQRPWGSAARMAKHDTQALQPCNGVVFERGI